MSFRCHEIGCQKAFKARQNLIRHKNNSHPWIFPSCDTFPLFSSMHQTLQKKPFRLEIQSSASNVLSSMSAQSRVSKRPGSTMDFPAAKVFKPQMQQQPPIESAEVDNIFFGFPSEVHYRANLSYCNNRGIDRPNGRSTILLCDCPGSFFK